MKNPRSVRFGDGNLRVAVGAGNISLTVVKSLGLYEKFMFNNVWYVPHLKRNLISQSLLKKQGMIGEIRPDKVTIRNPTTGTVLFHAFCKGGLLHLWSKENEHEHTIGVNVSTFLFSNSNELKLRHERLVHNNMTNIKEIRRCFR